MKTIGALAKQFNLSRSTLLYYDRMGLLEADGRSAAGYRLYSEAAVERLHFIVTLREAGLPLTQIKALITQKPSNFQSALEQRLSDLNGEIATLREQQQIVISLLKNNQLLNKSRVMNKARWVEILKASGMDESQMHQWHRQFEAMSPEAHQDFLESLGIAADEIKAIRRRSAK